VSIETPLEQLPIAEVTLSTTTQFVAQCIELPRPSVTGTLPEPPPFGSVVRIVSSRSSDTTTPKCLYAIVFHVETGSLEGNRPLSALGLTEEELQRDQPQIYELLVTRFTAILIGYETQEGTMRHYLPPRPPRPHAHVFLANDTETRAVTEQVGFLRGFLLAESGITPADELVAALLRNALRVRPGDSTYLPRVGREIARLLLQDTDRLRALLEKVMG
jgi:hypothetical protein